MPPTTDSRRHRSFHRDPHGSGANPLNAYGKDGINSTGVGAFFNVTDFGQMYTFHVILLPLAIVVLVIAHVLLVRRHGVVPPYPAKARRAEPATPPPQAAAGQGGAP